MKRVYSASDLVDAQLLADSLADARIQTHLLNANAIGAQGDIPFTNTWPEVWIADERDTARAATIVKAHSSRALASGTVRCTECGEDSPSNFASCWNCSQAIEAARDGSAPA